MQKILIVDDSALTRRILTSRLEADPDLEVIGQAENGRAALEMIDNLIPDVIVLDLDMPIMNGFEMLHSLRARHADLPVIIFSVLSERGSVATVDALLSGADDYVTKPTGDDTDQEIIEEQLIPKIKACVQKGKRPAGQDEQQLDAPPQTTSRQLSQPIELVVVAASTGGPKALATLLTELPADFSVPILIAQHMPARFTHHLAERLSSKSPLNVVEASGGETLKPGCCWVAPGNHHMVLSTDAAPRIAINQSPPVNSCRPSADVLFESTVPHFRANVLAIVLTGMGRDGLVGCTAINAAGGEVWVQDESTSVVWGMPGQVVQANLADRVLAIDEIAPQLVERLRS